MTTVGTRQVCQSCGNVQLIRQSKLERCEKCKYAGINNWKQEMQYGVKYELSKPIGI